MVFYGPSTLFRSFWEWSVNLSTLFFAKPPRQYSVHIFLPVTDNHPSWISGGERMAVEIISCLISTKECCWTWGSNPWLSAYQVDVHPTELPCLAWRKLCTCSWYNIIYIFISKSEPHSYVFSNITMTGSKSYRSCTNRNRACPSWLVIHYSERFRRQNDFRHIYWCIPL